MSTAIAPQDRHAPKLPLWDTVTLAYSSYVQNFRDVLRISWLWLAVVMLLPLVGGWIEAFWMSVPIVTTAVSLIATLIFALVSFSIAVAWHRRLLLGETPGLSGSNMISNNLWHYVGTGFLISLIAMLPVMIGVGVVFPFANMHNFSGFLIFIPYLLCIAMCAIALRLSLVLPARAVTDLTLSFTQVWADTRGNTWRLFWGTVACALLPLSVMPILLALMGFYTPRTFAAGSVAVINTLSTFYSLLVLPIAIGFLSFAYRHFFGPVSHPVGGARPEG